MDLFTIIVALVLVGIALWAINSFVPLDSKIKKILNITVIVIVIFWLIKVSGLLGYLRSVHV